MQGSDIAVILGRVQVKNNNHVLKAISKELGLVSFYVSAGTKKKLARNAVLQPLSICQVVYSNNKKSSLLQLKEARLEHTLLNIQTNVVKSSIALFLAEFLQQVSPTENDDRFFNFLETAILMFNEIETSNFHLWFMLQCTYFVGINPSVVDGENVKFDLKNGVFSKLIPNHPHYLNEEESNYIKFLLKEKGDNLDKAKIATSIKRKLIHNICQYYTFHFPGFSTPKSLSVLEEVFS